MGTRERFTIATVIAEDIVDTVRNNCDGGGGLSSHCTIIF